MRNDKIFQAIWGKTFLLLRRRGGCFLKVSAVFFVPAYLLDTYFRQNLRLIREVINRSSLKTFFVIDDILVFGMVLAFVLYVIALFRSVHMADQDKRVSVISVYYDAFDMLGPYLWVNVLFVLKVLARSLFFLIPGIVAGAYYGFAGPALLVDRRHGSAALFFSREIVKPRVKEYLKCVSLSVIYLLTACAVGVTMLDGLIIFSMFEYNWKFTIVLDCAEAGWLAVMVILWQIFYYYFYQEFKRVGKLS